MQTPPPASPAAAAAQGTGDGTHCMHRSSPLSNECFAEDDIAATVEIQNRKKSTLNFAITKMLLGPDLAFMLHAGYCKWIMVCARS